MDRSPAISLLCALAVGLAAASGPGCASSPKAPKKPKPQLTGNLLVEQSTDGGVFRFVLRKK